MALTSPDNIWTPDSGDGYALTQDLASFADTIQDALEVRANYYTGNNSQMTNQESKAPEGSMFFNTDDGKEYRLVSGAWVEEPVITQDSYNYRWADSTARNAQTGMVAGDLGYQTDTGVVYRYDGSAWKAWESDWITWATPPTNLTIGTGGSAAMVQRYRWVAGRLSFQYSYTLGTSGFSVGNIVINLPFPVFQAVVRFPQLVGSGTLYDASTTNVSYTGFPRLNGTEPDKVVIGIYAGTYTTINSTTPWTWAAGDVIGGEFWADPA